MKDPDAPKSHLLTNKVYVDLNVLRSTMVDWVGGDVVAVDERGLVNITKQLLEQLTYPRALGHDISHARYSASTLERETVGCRFDDQEINEGPR